MSDAHHHSVSRRTSRAALLYASLGVMLLVGCAKPNAANIELRKENTRLAEALKQFQTEREAEQKQMIAATQPDAIAPAIAPERLRLLFTTHSIRLGRLTGFATIDKSPGLKVFITPIDQAGDALKAAGAIKVEAFDLPSGGTLVGQWSFTSLAARELWNGQGLLYEYVVPCAFERPVSSKEITVRVTFIDELSGRVFSEQTIVKP